MKPNINPIPDKDFDKKKFKPHPNADDDRERLDKMPKKLPTKGGMMPPPIRDGQMVGQYESKQTLYLTFAQKCNEYEDRISKLEEEVQKLKNS